MAISFNDRVHPPGTKRPITLQMSIANASGSNSKSNNEPKIMLIICLKEKPFSIKIL